MNHKIKAVAVLLTTGMVPSAWPTPAAADVLCPPNLGSVTVDDNVNIVASCEMRGTEVEGNVRLFAGGSLHARGVEIDGNVQGQTAFDVDVADSTVDGNVELDDLVGDLILFADTEVDGNIRLRGNRALVQLVDNDVRSNVEASRNRGGVNIVGNVVGGNLDCTGNEPAPTGDDNRVRGKTGGQCRNLMAQAAPAPSDDSPPPAPAPPAPAPPDAGSGESPPPAAPGESPPPPSPGTADAPPTAVDGDSFNPVTDGAKGGGGGSVDLLTWLVLWVLTLCKKAALARRTVLPRLQRTLSSPSVSSM